VLLAVYFSHQTHYGLRPTPLKSIGAIYSETAMVSDFNDTALYRAQLDYYLSMARMNLPYLGRDRQVTRDPELQQRLAAVGTWLCFEPLTANALMLMANPDADFIFLFEDYDYPGGKYEQVRRILPSPDEIGLYAIVDSSGIGRVGQFFRLFFDEFAEAGLVIVESKPIDLDVTYAGQTHRLVRLLTAETAERLGLRPLSLEDVLAY
jgi:hypothetical protein